MFKFYIKRSTIYRNDPPQSPPTSPPPPPPAKTFTQEDVNRLLAENKRTLQQENQILITELEKFKNIKGISEQEKADLEARIATLQDQHLTKEQLQAKEVDTLKKKYDADTKSLQERENLWKGRYETTTITNSILAGANKHDAISGEQMVLLLSSRAKVVETVGEDGKPTGEFVVKTKVKSVDPKTKQPVELELPIIDAIGEMKKDTSYFNLFKGEGTGGLGGSGNARGGTDTTTGFKKGMSTEDYMAQRSKNKGKPQ